MLARRAAPRLPAAALQVVLLLLALPLNESQLFNVEKADVMRVLRQARPSRPCMRCMVDCAWLAAR